MQIWAESGKPALPICNYSQILYQFLTFTQNLKRSRFLVFSHALILRLTYRDYLHPPMSQTSPEVSTSSTFNVPYLCFSSYAQAAPIAAFAAVLDPLSFPVHIRQDSQTHPVGHSPSTTN